MTDNGENPKDRLGALKPQLDLFPPAALILASKVMGLGAKKYGPYNWRKKKVKYTVYVGAAMRHLLSALDGEDTDPESTMPHMAHALACCAIFLDALATGNLVDDRPTPGVAGKLIADLTEKLPPAPPPVRNEAADLEIQDQTGWRRETDRQRADTRLLQQRYAAETDRIATQIAEAPCSICGRPECGSMDPACTGLDGVWPAS